MLFVLSFCRYCHARLRRYFQNVPNQTRLNDAEITPCLLSRDSFKTVVHHFLPNPGAYKPKGQHQINNL